MLHFYFSNNIWNCVERENFSQRKIENENTQTRQEFLDRNFQRGHLKQYGIDHVNNLYSVESQRQ